MIVVSLNVIRAGVVISPAASTKPTAVPISSTIPTTASRMIVHHPPMIVVKVAFFVVSRASTFIGITATVKVPRVVVAPSVVVMTPAAAVAIVTAIPPPAEHSRMVAVAPRTTTTTRLLLRLAMTMTRRISAAGLAGCRFTTIHPGAGRVRTL